MNITLECEIDALNRNIAALSAMTGKTARESVRAASVMILQSGANMAPQAKKANRDILRAVRRYRRNVEELAINARPEAPGDKALFLIRRPRHRKPISRSGDRKFWVFETMAAARDHRAITFRGIGKAGFWSQFPALGKEIPKGYLKTAFLADVPGIRSTTVKLDEFVPTITVTNSVRGISDYVRDFEHAILLKVNNRIAGMAKANEKKLAAFRRAGGVAWNDSAQAYEELETEVQGELPF